MKRVERLTVKQITELRQMIKSKKSDNVEMRRAQSILLINSLAQEEPILLTINLLKTLIQQQMNLLTILILQNLSTNFYELVSI